MGAPALAPSRPPAPRRAPARRPAPRRRAAPRPAVLRPNPALAGAALLPHAAVRTAGAVRDLSDSSLIVRLTAGRGWIAVLCALLGGIVALNVVSLSLNAGSGRVSEQVAEMERANSALRAELAEELSSSRVEAAAAGMGLSVPQPEDVAYLKVRDGDAVRFLAMLEDGTLLIRAGPPETSSEPTAYYEQLPAVGEEAAPTVVTPEPTTPAPAPAAPAPAPPSSGSTGGTGL